MKRSRKRQLPVKGKCPFCLSVRQAGKAGSSPTYQDFEVLRNYISERGKILGRSRTGVCAKHQRRLTTAIKQTRYLALLPFVTQIK